ncbi:MAG: WecB/TagA/CpsF family glycosyltransferase [Cyanobacteria bacterium P01_H01_bin.15]
MTQFATSSVLGLPVHLSDDYVGWLLHQWGAGQGSHVVTINAEMALLGSRDRKLADIIGQADLVIPDGAGVVLYLRFRGIKQPRMPGIELAEQLLTTLGSRSAKVCFFGGKPGIASAAADHWRTRAPGLAVIENHGYLKGIDLTDWQAQIKAEQPLLILVGMGVPRQEEWIIANRDLCPGAIWIGVGGSFDIWSGNKERAPQWMCRANLEWLYRLYQEPWRWRRMLALPQFFFNALTYRDASSS